MGQRARRVFSLSMRLPRFRSGINHQAPNPQRGANVAYAHSLLQAEEEQRNRRKESQEATARWMVATVGVVLTLLVGLAKDEGVFSSTAPLIAKGAFIAVGVFGILTAVCALACLWPRPYQRLGKALKHFKEAQFLDRPEHQVMGEVVATRIRIVERMDVLHERKARWLKWAFVWLVCAFVGLLIQGADLAIDPPVSEHSMLEVRKQGSTDAP